ncbi:HAMP domain-containing sensor histidine kinase [Oceanimonas pelagia]|uniref:histidine kinase n=2 Tax=Oceanimonas pelagia TaxID=3028314 RepID=A0AA50Q848_9GAMM|nr:HAMP domain-containing sensor histidine kinase [Oceanimonas pelagia]WMC11365.1 HAMP domain-containing sensor histidine kinase [Oceanimonas pelagia]
MSTFTPTQSAPHASWLALLGPARLEEVLHTLPGGLLWVDGQGVVSRANAAARALLGEPLLNTPWLDVIARAFAPRPDDGLQVSLHDGRRVQLAISHLPGLPGQLVQLTDFTPTRAWAEQQGHAERLAALGRMAATLAHQIRTPLSAAMLYGANLASPGLDLSQRQRFQQRLMDRLGDIERQISDILLYARPDQAALAEPLCVNTLLNAAVEAAAPLLAGKASLECRVEPGLEVLGNGNSLQGIVLNLLENAVEAGADALTLVAGREGDWALIRLADNGKGMDEALQKQIFTPFFTTRSQGSGLGLAAVASVLRAHQGRVEVSSAPGRGSCFSLWLPLAANKEA